MKITISQNYRSAGVLCTLLLIIVIVFSSACAGASTVTAVVTTTATVVVSTSTQPTTSQPSISTQPTTSALVPTSIPPVTGALLNGQDIFLNGVDASGVHVTAQGFAMMTRWFACADCHGTNGHGGTVYMMMAQYDVANITWAALTGPDYVPPYTVATVKTAITTGKDQQNQSLDPFMPRWIMSDQDLTDLIGYLQTLK